MRSKVALMALVAGVLAIAPASAQAAPGNDTFIEATDFVVNGGRQSGDAIATCPAGSRVVSGGVSTTGPAPVAELSSYGLMLSGPLDSSGLTANTDDGDVARHWYGAVHNIADSPQLFKVFALCSRTSDAVVEATSFSLPVIGAGGAVARCPAGSRALGGGLGTTGAITLPIIYGMLLSGPRDETGVTGATVNGNIPREWASTMFNFGGGPDFKAFALCSAQSDATLAIADLTVPSNSAGLATVRCPVDSRVLGGGIHTLGPTPGGQTIPYHIMLSSPLDESGTTANTLDGDEPRFWFAYMRNEEAAQRLFKLSAVCAPEDPQPGGGGGKQQPGGGGGPGGGGPGGGQGQRCDGRVATIVGTKRGETLRGTRRSDVIVALGGNDRVIAGRGNDVVCGGSGNDRIDGGSGNDRLLGSTGKDTLVGASGRDALVGGAGRDSLSGGAGKDRQTQ
jgi:Ca2+-binding RTX toxin-like protein